MRAPILRLHTDELIIDSFAGGGGASLGIEMALRRSHRIEHDLHGKPFTKSAQVRMCGNSVCPPVAAAILRAQFAMAAA